MSGFVYLATNESMQEGLVKIGMTSKSVEERMKGLSSETGVPTSYVCRFSCEVDNPREVEGRLHKLFNYCKHGKGFYKIDWQIVMIALLLFADKLSDESVEEVQTTSGEEEKVVQSRAEQYKAYVCSTVDKPIRPITADRYHKALLEFDKGHYIRKNIYDIKSVQTAQEIKDKLTKGGDLYELNLDPHIRSAMEKYVEFLKWEVMSKKSITSERFQHLTHHESRAEQYKEFACKHASKTITKAVAVIDHKALLHLGKTHIHKNIYDIRSVQEAQAIKDRLLKSKGGDLWEFDRAYNPPGSMSAAMGKYIEFLGWKNEE